jgi:hypothetical protein
MTWLCSNEKCPDKSKLSKGSSCPTCKSLVEEYRYGRLFHHLSVKATNKIETKSKEGGAAEREPRKKDEVLSPEMSDEEIEEAIRKDLKSVSSRHDWLDLPDILESGDMDSPEDRLLTTLIDQGKILIRQNELILRILKRVASRTVQSNSTNVTVAAPEIVAHD